MIQPEQWRPAVGWPGYEVSSEGRVRSLDRVLVIGESYNGEKAEHARGRAGRMLTAHQHSNGYLSVRLAPGGKTVMVHRLVCYAFHGAPPDIDCHADHKNRIRSDNRAENLRWLTPALNRAGRDCARGERQGSSKLTAAKVQQIFMISQRSKHPNKSDQALAAEHGVTREAIRDIRVGKTWKHVTARVASVPVEQGVSA